jgi:apolipoprotein D and lipocalin family protein
MWKPAALLAAPLALLTGCASAPPRAPAPGTVAYVDLDRYMGDWFVLQHIPYFLERGKVASYDTYARRPDGRLTNNFTFRRDSVEAPEETWYGVAWITNPATNAEWKVRFVWPLTVRYHIVALDPDYRWAVVATADRELMWVLARERALPADIQATITAQLAAAGLRPERLADVPQPTATSP